MLPDIRSQASSRFVPSPSHVLRRTAAKLSQLDEG
jgi:hypothetical protein